MEEQFEKNPVYNKHPKLRNEINWANIPELKKSVNTKTKQLRLKKVKSGTLQTKMNR